MQTEIHKFVFPLTGQETRIVDRNQNPWWVLKDVCEVLSIANVGDAADRLDEDEKAAVVLDDTSSNGVTQSRKMTVINEAGLYNLVLRSDKPEAKTFRRWVTHEVLPSIRKTGSYGDPIVALGDPAALRGLLLTYTEKVIALEAKVAEQAPKVEAMRRLEGADGSLCVTNAAKALCIRPKELFSYLQACKWIYKRAGSANWVGYQDKIQSGLVEMSEYLQAKPDGTETVRVQARITAKGLARLAAEFESVIGN